jgi:hypothetical protein
MTRLFHDDGCVIANIPVKPYRVMFEPECEHTKIRAAEIVILAESADSALHYARNTLRLPRMRATHAEEITAVTG